MFTHFKKHNICLFLYIHRHSFPFPGSFRWGCCKYWAVCPEWQILSDSLLWHVRLFDFNNGWREEYILLITMVFTNKESWVSDFETCHESWLWTEEWGSEPSSVLWTVLWSYEMTSTLTTCWFNGSLWLKYLVLGFLPETITAYLCPQFHLHTCHETINMLF